MKPCECGTCEEISEHGHFAPGHDSTLCRRAGWHAVAVELDLTSFEMLPDDHFLVGKSAEEMTGMIQERFSEALADQFTRYYKSYRRKFR